MNASRAPAGSNTQKYAAQKFEKEFYYVVVHLFNDLDLSESNSANDGGL